MQSKKCFIPLYFTLIAGSILLNCTNKSDNEDGNTGPFDVTTMATPEGGYVKPAQDGPVRSVLGEPEIDTDTFHLTVSGLVDSPFTLSWDKILAYPPAFTDTILMYCVEGWEVWGNWKGLLIESLLAKAHVRPEGTHVHFTCADGYDTSLPRSYLLKYRIILAYEVNGFPLTVSDGYPLRLVAFGKFGYKWAKWITRLEVTDESFIGYWEGYGYTDKADVPMDRRRFYEGDTAQQLEY